MTARTFEVIDPATAEVIHHVPDQSIDEARAAARTAAHRLPVWAALAPRDRSDVLARTFALMQRDAEKLAALIVAENGKSWTDARAEIAYAAEFFRWYAEEAVRPGGDYGSSPTGRTRTVVTHRPVGVAALVTPWNFPAAMVTRKVAPALAAGCTVLLKPAAETPCTALAIVELLIEAGLPEGIVNVVTTTDAPAVVGAWLEDPRVRKLSFTGSTAVGRQLLGQAAQRVLRTSMELGGNAPFIITADAELDAAVEAAVVAKFRNGGQACIAANRFYVHERVEQEFLARFGARVESLVVGSAAAGGDVGPMITQQARHRVRDLVESALAEGARVAYRSDPPASTGYFHPALVLSGVPANAGIVREEIFGPVAPVISWSDTTLLMEHVNDTEAGLAAYVFAGDLKQALGLAEQIDAGMVGINRGLVSDASAPFGGVKQSGLGREGGRAGLEEYRETQYFSLDWS